MQKPDWMTEGNYHTYVAGIIACTTLERKQLGGGFEMISFDETDDDRKNNSVTVVFRRRSSPQAYLVRIHRKDLEECNFDGVAQRIHRTRKIVR